MKSTDLEDKSILILGLGKEGLSTLNFLSKHFPNKKFAVADKKMDLEIPLMISEKYFGDDYLEALDNYQVIIKSPGVPSFRKLHDLKKKGIAITSSTQIFFNNFKGQIIGVTGTKGKSTTSSLIYQVLKDAGLDVYLLGNIGTVSLDLLDNTNKDSIVVFELSSFQLEDLDYSPHIAVITNIYPEHLDRYNSFEDYKKAKLNITKFQTESDYLIYEDSLKDEILDTKATKLPISEGKIDFINLDKLLLKGEANLKNIQTAVLVAKILNIDQAKVKTAVEGFPPLPHRLEFVTEKKGIRFYNDSLSTIPQTTIAALQALGEDVQTLIIGGFDRGVDYSILGPAILNSGVENLILFPTTGEKIWKSLASHMESGNVDIKRFDVNSMEEAVKIAFKVTESGKVVLLSPASTSFNMFKNYEDRGNQFKKYISEQ